MTELILFVLLIFFSIGVWLIVLTSSHAYRRGYNPVVWALAAIIAMNPIFLFVVLALAPHRSRLRLRTQFRAELDAKLAGHEPLADGKPTGAIPQQTQTERPQRHFDSTQTFMGNE